MKKAKFALTAVVVLSVIGGAVAFKARSNGKPVFTNNAQQKCVVTQPGLYTATVTATTVTPIISYATTTLNAACPTVGQVLRVE